MGRNDTAASRRSGEKWTAMIAGHTGGQGVSVYFAG